MNSIHYSAIIYNHLKKLNFGLFFEEGYRYLRRKTREESVTRLYHSIRGGMSLEDILELVG